MLWAAVGCGKKRSVATVSIIDNDIIFIFPVINP